MLAVAMVELDRDLPEGLSCPEDCPPNGDDRERNKLSVPLNVTRLLLAWC